MIERTPHRVAEHLVKKGGMPQKHFRPVRRELKTMRAMGILMGVKSFLGPDTVCIDLGAHKGYVTRDLAATGTHVISFEPDPGNFALLQENTADFPNVELHQAAVGVEDGTLRLYAGEMGKDDEGVASTSLTTLKESGIVGDEEGIEVKCVDFVKFLEGCIEKHGRVSFLKMDIEGSEVPVLEALLETDLLEHVNMTVVETHRWLFRDWRGRYDWLNKQAEQRPELNLFLGWI